MDRGDGMTVTTETAATSGAAEAPGKPFDPSEGGFLSNGTIAFLIFLLGVVTGFPAATLGVAFFIDNAVPVFGAIVGVLVIALSIIGLILVFRKRIWAAIFKRGEVEAARIATPLTNVARFTAEQKLGEAALAARELVEMGISRYAWITTRRWMLATLTALVAAIAALAGAALLFQQNQLLRSQADLLAEQNQRISEQTTLLQAQIQLGEAQRSTSIVPEILSIGAAIGEETALLVTDERPVPIFFANELSLALRARIIAATNAARPYRHLISALSGLSQIDLIAAAVKRRTDLPTTIADYQAWQERQPLAVPLEALGAPAGDLTDREVSPERGQLISLLFNSRILDTEELSFNGADFSFAEVHQPALGPMTFRHAKLRFADFSNIELQDVNFGAAFLDHTRFRFSRLSGVKFSSLRPAEIVPPFSPDPAVPLWHTQMNGVDFNGAYIDKSHFVGIQALGAIFDNTIILDTSFNDAALAASTFRNAVLHGCTFEGASLASVDFDGAIVFEPDFLETLAASATNFVAGRYRLEAISFADMEYHPHALDAPEELVAALVSGEIIPYRVVRIADFETPSGPSSTGFFASEEGPAAEAQ